MELPECPVCLQVYDDRDAIPRVLSCGHSVCEACLVELLQRYPNTIRCPACTQLVKYPSHQGPSSLPKNIDLLRLCLQHSPSSDHSKKSNQRSTINASYDHSPFWSREFYATWKDWILPHDAVLIDEHGLGLLNSSSSCKGRVCFGVNKSVSLVPIVCFAPENCSKFKFSYVAWVIKCLEGMSEVAREELVLVLEGSVRQGRVCRVYGLWSEGVDGALYLVCERHCASLLDKFSELRNGFVGVHGDGLDLDKGGIFSFAVIGLGLCQSVLALHLEGLVAGCLGLSCFSSDELGGICIDLNEVLVMGRKFVVSVSGVTSDKQKEEKEEGICKVENELFMSPEVLWKLLCKGAIVPDSGCSRYAIGYGSDVWSLACVLLWLLIGNALPRNSLEMNEENGFDISASYVCWLEKVSSVLEDKLGSEYQSLRQTLCKCLDIDPGSRPDVVEVRKCIQDMVVKPQFDYLGNLEVTISRNNTGRCLVLGELCKLPKSSKESRKHELLDKEDGGQSDFVLDSKDKSEEDFVAGLSKGMTELKELRGHLDCISGLTVGGGYLFSSSFDKTIHVWSLQDFSHLHTFRGHESKVMGLVYVDEEEPLCISGDSGGGIFIWGTATPLRQDPLRKWYEKKDWRFSGIHSLAVSSNFCLYTGGGDRTIKAWSLKDETLICTMTGHRSVVSTLAVCDEVLYSGSWDGTVRLWSLSDHSQLTALGEDMPGEMKSILAVTVNRHLLVAAYENGYIKVWRNDVFMNSTALHNGAIFAMSMQEKCLYTGGWDKNVNIQELSGDEFELDVRAFGSIPCSSIVTAILCSQGKLYVGYANKSIKVYHGK